MPRRKGRFHDNRQDSMIYGHYTQKERETKKKNLWRIPSLSRLIPVPLQAVPFPRFPFVPPSAVVPWALEAPTVEKNDLLLLSCSHRIFLFLSFILCIYLFVYFFAFQSLFSCVFRLLLTMDVGSFSSSISSDKARICIPPPSSRSWFKALHDLSSRQSVSVIFFLTNLCDPGRMLYVLCHSDVCKKFSLISKDFIPSFFCSSNVFFPDFFWKITGSCLISWKMIGFRAMVCFLYLISSSPFCKQIFSPSLRPSLSCLLFLQSLWNSLTYLLVFAQITGFRVKNTAFLG